MVAFAVPRHAVVPVVVAVEADGGVGFGACRVSQAWRVPVRAGSRSGMTDDGLLGLVAGVDRGPVAARLPRRSGCTGVPRSDLPVDVRPAGVHPGPGTAPAA